MNKSVTLIELIVVIAIIAILASIITPNTIKYLEKSKIAKTAVDMKTIRSAGQSFFADTGIIPCRKAGGWGKDPGFINRITAANCWPDQGGCAAGCVDIVGWSGPYLKNWPKSSPWSADLATAPAGGKAGMYNWNFESDSGFITLESYTAVPIAVSLRLDEILDDGNLSTGDMYGLEVPSHAINGVDPDYINYLSVKLYE
ncbi:MAG: prepilin-type N-terminal cleavage/methylation domain-containing protein [Candidatus Omnitrophica bacterium]|nr:prepilin-type N-terminal cleavage/methylation domain-containing protein [Candidatus Omnitrophota bacterium]MBU2251564.1 prepilin-type N-terminal cleavage/methylation domain-containing protein [Candidatus Omnitrophota bacterium]